MSDERIRPSATVILWRKVPHLEVFLLERNKKTRFFPGYHAFPGGVVDAADGEGPEGRRIAACRELQEETGVHLPAEALEPAGQLITPAFGPVRYDTSFFLGEMPAGAEAAVDGQESLSGRWWRPADALASFRSHTTLIPPPTVAFLRLLETHGDPLKVAETVRATDGKRHHERFRIEIHPGVYVLPLRAPTLPPATTQNCYLFDSDPILVVDPGSPEPDQHTALFHTLEGMLAEDQREILVLLTHHHRDHVGAVEAVQKRFGVRVLAAQETRDALPERMVDGVIAEGHVFDIGQWDGHPWRVDVMHTPGHTPGHLAFRDARFGAILAGDLVSGVSTIMVDPREGDMGQYLHSLERCSSMEPPIVLPGHGPAIPRDAFAHTLAHRRMREEKLVKTLSATPRTIDELVPIVYDDAPQAAWPLAARNLESHLLHLEATGRAVREGGAWRTADAQ